MKAKPVKLIEGSFIPCDISEVTHVKLMMPTGRFLFLPVILKGSRDDTGCWTWNGDVDKPTLRPSVLTTTPDPGYRCHSWINDGQAQFLSDCSHELVNQTVDLLDVD